MAQGRGNPMTRRIPVTIRQIPVRRPSRVRTVEPTDRVPFRRLIPLVLAETLGLAALSVAYWGLDAQYTVLAPFLVPPLVSFVLVFATAHNPASRPLRVVASYAIAGAIGLVIGVWPIPGIVAGILAGAITLMVMHLVGAFHAPAVAAALIAAYVDHSWATAIVTLPLLVGTAALVVALVWVTHRLLGDREYPTLWW
jgi:CBS-domain-containing membrane protein